MALRGLSGCALPGRARTTVRVPGVRVAPDLLERDFNPTAPDRTGSADITEIPTLGREAVPRACPGPVLPPDRRLGDGRAHAQSTRLGGAADGRRAPPTAAGLIHYSDHGLQYTVLLFTGRCVQAGIEVSMGSSGDCFDNAVCESSHASLKKELIHRRPWPTRADARSHVFEYIESWFNPRRRHSTLGYLSPAAYEQEHHDALAATPPDGAGLTTERVDQVPSACSP